MLETIVLPARFRGPPESANGGYACGAIAGLLEGPAEVTLRRPPPLDTPLMVSRLTAGSLEVHDGEGLIAEGRTVDDELEVPPPLDIHTAVAAVAGYRGFHPGATFASCFVCSPDRDDGLRIFPGPVGGVLAAPWTPGPDVADSNGRVLPEIVWAALDCPTFFASTEPGQLALLGRMAASMGRPVWIDEPHVVVARPAGHHGRKRFGISALYSTSGELLAQARATWITIEV